MSVQTFIQRDDKGQAVEGAPSPALKHGARSETLMLQPGMAEAHAELVSLITADLGGDVSTLKAAMIRELARVILITESMGADLFDRGMLTKKGNTRAAVSVYALMLDRQSRLTAMVGLARVPKSTNTLRDYAKAAQ